MLGNNTIGSIILGGRQHFGQGFNQENIFNELKIFFPGDVLDGDLSGIDSYNIGDMSENSETSGEMFDSAIDY
jgi:hypothetical protein